MELLLALLKSVFDGENAGGHTLSVNIHMVSPTDVAEISRCSTCGLDETKVKFRPYLPLDEALIHVKKYSDKGVFRHGDGKDD